VTPENYRRGAVLNRSRSRVRGRLVRERLRCRSAMAEYYCSSSPFVAGQLQHIAQRYFGAVELAGLDGVYTETWRPRRRDQGETTARCAGLK
jgi:hypothetical protein